VAHLARLHIPIPSMWCLDVETSNSWSRDRRLNTSALRGTIAFLSRADPTGQVGIYSRRAWWREITAGWSAKNPEWIPSIKAACPPPFAHGPVWLHQTASPGADLDTVC
jgi:GH25 family lysozyme M1 (1,4-beta-N-acetylmuramidase)